MDDATGPEAHDALFHRYRTTRDPVLRDELVVGHGWIALRCARRFLGRGEPLEDLQQVAQIGLVKAVERFDPELGHRFLSYAVPTVVGELRRHFRDATWSLSVPRRLKDLASRLAAARDQLHHELGRAPRVDELALAMHVDPELVVEAIEANQCYRAVSIDAEPHLQGFRANAGDGGIERAEVRMSTLDALARLDDRSRQIVVWRFYEGRTQAEIGDRLGIGQVQVSRLLRAAFDTLRCELGNSEVGGELASVD